LRNTTIRPYASTVEVSAHQITSGSPFGQFKVSTTCDLECYDFDSFLTKPCRWRNEKNTCDVNGDEIDFIRMKGSWGESEGDTIFGKSDRAANRIDSMFEGVSGQSQIKDYLVGITRISTKINHGLLLALLATASDLHHGITND
ncbi:hypothetical protein ANCCAN_23368, partial [Ancylostoma caninum]